VDRVRVDVDALDWSLPEFDVLVQLVMSRADDLVGAGQPERDEEQSWLVDVVIVLVDDDDLDLFWGKDPSQAVGAERPPGSSTEDHDPFGHGPMVGHPS
jgi:hypothetical protein